MNNNNKQKNKNIADKKTKGIAFEEANVFTDNSRKTDTRNFSLQEKDEFEEDVDTLINKALKGHKAKKQKKWQMSQIILSELEKKIVSISEELRGKENVLIKIKSKIEEAEGAISILELKGIEDDDNSLKKLRALVEKNQKKKENIDEELKRKKKNLQKCIEQVEKIYNLGSENLDPNKGISFKDILFNRQNDNQEQEENKDESEEWILNNLISLIELNVLKIEKEQKVLQLEYSKKIEETDLILKIALDLINKK